MTGPRLHDLGRHALFSMLMLILHPLQLTVFCIASSQAIVIALTPALTHFAPHLRETQFVVPRTQWEVSAPVAILGPPVAALVIIWAMCRLETWAWPLQDLMGLSMMLLILRQFRLPSIKVDPPPPPSPSPSPSLSLSLSSPAPLLQAPPALSCPALWIMTNGWAHRSPSREDFIG